MSIASANAIREEHAANSRARRARRDMEKYLRRTPPAQQRADNVRQAMSNGSFHQTRYDFNAQNAGRAEMDANGDISPVAPPARKEKPMTTVPAGGGSYKSVPAPSKDAPKPQPQAVFPRSPRGVIRDETGDRTAEIQRNLMPPRKAPSAQPAPAPAAKDQPSPAPTKTAGEMIADIDSTLKASKASMEKTREAFKPRSSPLATKPPAEAAPKPTAPAPQPTTPPAKGAESTKGDLLTRAAKLEDEARPLISKAADSLNRRMMKAQHAVGDVVEGAGSALGASAKAVASKASELGNAAVDALETAVDKTFYGDRSKRKEAEGLRQKAASK